MKKAVIDRDVTKGSLMAGQSVGLVKKVMPLKDIIDAFTRDAEAGMLRLKAVFRINCGAKPVGAIRYATPETPPAAQVFSMYRIRRKTFLTRLPD